jgi:hypothetical protein
MPSSARMQSPKMDGTVGCRRRSEYARDAQYMKAGEEQKEGKNDITVDEVEQNVEAARNAVRNRRSTNV